jgi:hypothetical protein
MPAILRFSMGEAIAAQLSPTSSERRIAPLKVPPTRPEGPLSPEAAVYGRQGERQAGPNFARSSCIYRDATRSRNRDLTLSLERRCYSIL